MAQITGTIFGSFLKHPFILVDTFYRPLVPKTGFTDKVSVLTYKNFVVMGDEINAFLKRHFNKEKARFTLELDQSTTCSGITLCEEKERIICVFDFSREGASTGRYEVQLQSFIRHLIKDLRLCYVVTERPLPPGAGRNAKSLKKKYGETSTKIYTNDKVGNTLRAFQKEIKSWSSTIPELNMIPMDDVFPHVWRKNIPNFRNIPYRNSRKEHIASDIQQLYPGIAPYIFCNFNNTFDGVESLGIHYGYKKAKFDDDGNLKNFSSTITKSTLFIIPRYVSKSDKNLLANITYGFKGGEDLDIVKEDKELSFFDNARYLAGERDAGVLEITSIETYVSLLWRLQTDLDSTKQMYCIVCKKSYLTHTQMNKFLNETHSFFLES